ncbi:MAG: M50 family metallopeptidase [Christensenellales bacterium]
MIVLYIVLAVVILLAMVTIHEFGHYTAGKMLGFKINEFSIGFGPALFSKTNKKNGEKFSVRLVPLGGYCAFDGEDTESDSETSFMKQKPWKRLIVLFFGAFFNFLSAIIFAFILLVSVGYDIPKITNIVEVNGNIQSELRVNDVITHVDGVKISYVNGNDFTKLIAKYGVGDRPEITVVRDGVSQTIRLDFFEDTDSSVKIGINMTSVPYGFWQALLLCVPFVFVMGWQILVLFGQLLIGKLALSNLGGPITTITTMATLSMQGASNILVLLPLLATNLAIFNWLPIPALDGSKMVFTTIEWIRGKPINQKVENTIHTVGLIVLFAIVIIADLYHLIF